VQRKHVTIVRFCFAHHSILPTILDCPPSQLAHHISLPSISDCPPYQLALPARLALQFGHNVSCANLLCRCQTNLMSPSIAPYSAILEPMAIPNPGPRPCLPLARQGPIARPSQRPTPMPRTGQMARARPSPHMLFCFKRRWHRRWQGVELHPARPAHGPAGCTNCQGPLVGIEGNIPQRLTITAWSILGVAQAI